jgi:hypothetical protein
MLGPKEKKDEVNVKIGDELQILYLQLIPPP